MNTQSANNNTELKIGLKLIGNVLYGLATKKEYFTIDEIKTKLVAGKKYLTAYCKNEALFTCTEKQSQNLQSFLKNDYKIVK